MAVREKKRGQQTFKLVCVSLAPSILFAYPNMKEEDILYSKKF